MYKYNDNVEIIKGFYEGLKGRLVDINSDNLNCYKEYSVEIVTRKPTFFYPAETMTITMPKENIRKV